MVVFDIRRSICWLTMAGVRSAVCGENPPCAASLLLAARVTLEQTVADGIGAGYANAIRTGNTLLALL